MEGPDELAKQAAQVGEEAIKLEQAQQNDAAMAKAQEAEVLWKRAIMLLHKPCQIPASSTQPTL